MNIRRDFDSQVTSQYCKVSGSIIVLCGRTVNILCAHFDEKQWVGRQNWAVRGLLQPNIRRHCEQDMHYMGRNLQGMLKMSFPFYKRKKREM